MTFVLLLAVALAPGMTRHVTLQKGGSDTYALQLKRGESAAIVVHQQGVDVVVEVISPAGALLDSVDGPTGRNGDENVEIIAATSGEYQLRIRPYDANEPAGDYTLEVTAVRSVAATQALLESRRSARNQAAAWLKPRSEVFPSDLRRFGTVAQRARVIGLGEATHGSREFDDARLLLTKLLIQRYGYRFVAVEASASLPETGWIGRRMLHVLLAFIDEWNSAHRSDPVRFVGVDAQQNAPLRDILRTFIEKAYGQPGLTAWNAAEKELIAADEQTLVFGDSSISTPTRDYLLKLRAMLDLDAPILRARFGDEALTQAQHAADIVAQFADFNSNDPQAHSRDWYMATNVLAAAGASDRAVYWAHNAHIASPRNGRTSGSILRSVLGCAYAPIAITFGEGSFIAEMPNDLDDRLAQTTLPAAPPETVEGVVSSIATTPLLTVWDCDGSRADLPAWLQAPKPMHWVGGLYSPDTLASSAFRPFDLLADFDGLLYFPRVTAEDIPADRPHIPARKR